MRLGSDAHIDVAVSRRLHNCLVHLINTALDHGIESPEERRNAGKRENGLLILSARIKYSMIELTLEDDGRGIDDEAVKKKLIEKKILDEEGVIKLTTEQLYSYLFRPGFSTKVRTSVISGRGVGMDIVADTMQKLHGTVSVESEQGIGTKITMNFPIL